MLWKIAQKLSKSVEEIPFSPPVHTVYNPLRYAAGPHRQYLERWGAPPREVLLLGMNPGPFGMVQTGVPFGDARLARDYLGIDAPVKRPAAEHPKRPVLGWDTPRREVSGRRIWSWARDTFGPAERFFARFFVANYCPLAFLEEGGRNRTPDKLPKAERRALYAACDAALARTVEVLRPAAVIGIGKFAEKRAREALPDYEGTVGSILHPSPANPRANRGWAEQATTQLVTLGFDVP
jgi:single-strand selective monofunctional uracil DNA glycosylase